MPLYEYRCLRCKKIFSLLQRVGATEKDTICPHCDSRDVKKIVSSFSCSMSGTDPSMGFTGGT